MAQEDLNIDNYNLDEILVILEAEPNKASIKISANILKNKLSGNLLEFIKKAEMKALILLDEHDDDEQDNDSDNEQDNDDVQENEHEDNDSDNEQDDNSDNEQDDNSDNEEKDDDSDNEQDDDSDNEQDDDGEEVEDGEKKTEENTKIEKFKLNPLENKIVKKVLAVDSIFRDTNIYKDSGDFVYQLPNPIENVISMSLLNAEIPNVIYMFSDELRNNKFKITMKRGYEIDYDSEQLHLKEFENKTIEIKIFDGSPNFKFFISSIQTQLDNQRNSFSLLKVGIDPINGKFHFRFKTLSECVGWNSKYYVKPADPSVVNSKKLTVYTPDNKPATEKFKLPSEKESGVPQYDYLKRIYRGTAIDNPDPSNCDPIDVSNIALGQGLEFTLDLNPDDWQPSEKTKSICWLMGFRSETSWKNKTISYDNKIIRNDIEYNGYIEADTPYGDNQQDYFYLVVEDFVGNYQDSLNASNKQSYIGESILARVQSRSAFGVVDFTAPTSSFLDKERRYFGPVNIRKLHIKFLDIYGERMYLGGSNYALTFQFEIYYSKIE